MLPGDRLVCAFVKPQAVGKRFSTWLLHVTIVPWFRLEAASAQVASGLSVAVTAIEPFEAVAGVLVMFGPGKNRPARLVRPTGPFEAVEQQVRSYLHKKHAWLADETTKRPRQFHPHVTAQHGRGLLSGQTFRCDTLYIVEQRGTYKEITAEITLG